MDYFVVFSVCVCSVQANKENKHSKPKIQTLIILSQREVPVGFVPLLKLQNILYKRIF